jgi:hypothetical protein
LFLKIVVLLLKKSVLVFFNKINKIYSMKKPAYTLLALFCMLILASKISAQIVYVNASAATNGDGTSWATAFNNLQNGLETAQSTANNTIWLAQGTYYPSKDTTGLENPSDPRTKTFYISQNCKIYGGFSGSETSLTQANPSLYKTILSGDIQNLNDSTDNAYHVMYMSNWTSQVSFTNQTVLQGFTIQGGYGYGPTNEPNRSIRGGAVYCSATSPNANFSPIFNQIQFNRNYARHGGSVYLGIVNNKVEAQFTNCTFSNSWAIGNNIMVPNGSGGAIQFNTNGTGEALASFTNCLFEKNISGSGACVYNILFGGYSYLTYTNCIFSKNSANGSGGVSYNCSNGNQVINIPKYTNCLFTENTAFSSRGAIYIIANKGENSVEVRNGTFYKNTANSGGAFYATKQPAALSNSYFYNSILWGTDQTNNQLFNRLGALSTTNQCIVYDGTPNGMLSPITDHTFVNCTDNDPQFMNPSMALGPDGKWATLDDGLQLSNCSPALDAGLDAQNTTTLDIRKNNRTFNAIPAGASLDLGAYEYQLLKVYETTTWLGNTSNAWSDPSNWSTNKVPNFCTDVTLVASTNPMPIVANGVKAQCHSLNTPVNSTVIVESNASLQVSN